MNFYGFLWMFIDFHGFSLISMDFSCLIPYILPNSCERFAGARVLPFNSCSLQAAIIN